MPLQRYGPLGQYVRLNPWVLSVHSLGISSTHLRLRLAELDSLVSGSMLATSVRPADWHYYTINVPIAPLRFVVELTVNSTQCPSTVQSPGIGDKYWWPSMLTISPCFRGVPFSSPRSISARSLIRRSLRRISCSIQAARLPTPSCSRHSLGR